MLSRCLFLSCLLDKPSTEPAYSAANIDNFEKINHTDSTMRRPARIFFLYAFVLSAFLFFVTPSFAQTQNTSLPTTTNPYQNLNTNPDVPATQRTAVDSLMINIMASMICNLSGIDVMTATPGQRFKDMPPAKCLGVDKETGKIGFVQNGTGAVGMMGNMIGALYRPPASSVDYTRYLAGNFGIVHTASAQATGFQSLRNLLPVWAVFRNITYFLFVLAFVVIGFLIMMRIHIDPRTVMTLQNSIPKLIMGILVITFSYAIAGFLIDLMWVTTYASIGVMSQAVKATDQSNSFTESAVTSHILDYPFRFFNKVFVGDTIGINILGTFEFARNAADGVGILFRSLTGSGDLARDLGENAGQIAGNACDLLVDPQCESGTRSVASYLGMGNIIEEEPQEDTSCGWNPICAIGNKLGGVIGNLIEAVFKIIAGIISWIVSLLAFLVILIAVIITLFRIWLTLLRAYIVILIGVVWAPFWILFGMFPGSSMNFTQWIRHMISHLVLFPATIIMFLMARVFIQAFEPSFWSGNDGSVFIPPLVGNANLPEALGPIIAFSVLMYVPHILNILRDALKSKASPYSAAPAQGAGAGFGVIKGTAGATFAYKEKIRGPGETGGAGAVLRRFI